MIKLKEFIQRVKSFINENPQRKKLLLIVFVLAIIPITVIAALTVQNLKQRASGGTGVQIVDVNGNFLPTTSNAQIFLRINLPENWTGRGGVGMNNNLINQAYAQTTGGSCSPPYQGYLGCFSSSNRPSGSACTSSCITDSGQNGKYCYTSTVVGNSCTSSTGQSGVCNEQGVCAGTGYLTPSSFTPTITPTLIPSATPTPTPTPASTQPICVSRTGFYSGAAGTFECCSGLTKCPSTGTCETSCATPPTPTPILNLLQGIYIENKDSDGSTNGSEPLRVTSGFESYIGTQVPWRLNDLLPGQTQALRIVNVTLFSSTGTSFTLSASVNLVRPNGPTNILSRVDVSFICPGNIGFGQISLDQIPVHRECHASALAYDTGNTPMYKDITYSWGISSSNSIGTLNKTSGNITNFYAQNIGTGSIWVIAQKENTQVQKGLEVRVISGAIIPTTNFISPNSPTISNIQQNVIGDLNGDGVVNCKDLKILIGQYGQKGTNLSADFNHDGIVDGIDYNMLIRNYTPGDTTVCPQ